MDREMRKATTLQPGKSTTKNIICVGRAVPAAFVHKNACISRRRLFVQCGSWTATCVESLSVMIGGDKNKASPASADGAASSFSLSESKRRHTHQLGFQLLEGLLADEHNQSAKVGVRWILMVTALPAPPPLTPHAGTRHLPELARMVGNNFAIYYSITCRLSTDVNLRNILPSLASTNCCLLCRVIEHHEHLVVLLWQGHPN